jgi:hypothetical protein
MRQMERELKEKDAKPRPIEDEADVVLDMELEDESQKTESALEDI